MFHLKVLNIFTGKEKEIYTDIPTDTFFEHLGNPNDENRDGMDDNEVDLNKIYGASTAISE